MSSRYAPARFLQTRSAEGGQTWAAAEMRQTLCWLTAVHKYSMGHAAAPKALPSHFSKRATAAAAASPADVARASASCSSRGRLYERSSSSGAVSKCRAGSNCSASSSSSTNTVCLFAAGAPIKCSDCCMRSTFCAAREMPSGFAKGAQVCIELPFQEAGRAVAGRASPVFWQVCHLPLSILERRNRCYSTHSSAVPVTPRTPEQVAHTPL